MIRLLLIIFFFAVIVRFFYFPDNVYFGYDQARDAFVSLGILDGHFKVLGPPSTFNSSIFHGALAYYIFAPFYFLSGGDPTLVSIFLRVFNAAGIFIVFLVGSKLFNKKAGIIAALLFAVSFEQTQYALFLSHPSLGVLSVLLFYLGLLMLFFEKNQKGLVLVFFGLGLSIQFHISLILLFPVMIIALILFRRNLPAFTLKVVLISILGFLLSTVTFILAELKYRNFAFILKGSGEGSFLNLSNLYPKTDFQIWRFVNDNMLVLPEVSFIGTLILIGLFGFIFFNKESRMKGLFLLVWFLGGLLPYVIGNSKIYYYGMGGSVSLLILAGFIIFRVYLRSKFLAVFLLAIVMFSNLYLIVTKNKTMFNEYIVVEEGMVIPREKEALDYIYGQSKGQSFSVNAVTIPYNVKTTWDYLFSWYGEKKYSYIPLWGGDAAPGYEGNLKVVTARSELPKKRFLIIEPTKNIPSYMIEKLITEEDYFSKITEVRSFGNITVQMREGY